MNNLARENLETAMDALAGFLEADGALPETLVVVGGCALISLGPTCRTLGAHPGRE